MIHNVIKHLNIDFFMGVLVALNPFTTEARFYVLNAIALST